MENSSLRELNTVLKGEHMAVEAYNRFIISANDENIKNEFESIRHDHEEHISKLSEHILKLGGLPETGTGIIGVFSNAKLTIETMRSDSTDILKKAYDGEDKGIAAVEKIVKGDLDDVSRQLVNGMLEKDHGHLITMSNLISQYEKN